MEKDAKFGRATGPKHSASDRTRSDLFFIYKRTTADAIIVALWGSNLIDEPTSGIKSGCELHFQNLSAKH
jgi:hypothetical protein